ncbi:MAG: DUF2892 domain-containing protein [Nitrospirae bacterium]|nr:MAG: DUF2892 domain-containing protein [Nitrospirota bacterium]
MSLERWVRLLSGLLIMLSVALAEIQSDAWLLVTALIAISLLQSGFTNWCPMMMFLKLLGIRQVCPVIFYEKKIEEIKYRSPD